MSTADKIVGSSDGLDCCPDWKPGLAKIDGFITLQSIRTGRDLYDGKAFKFCPWCGAKRSNTEFRLFDEQWMNIVNHSNCWEGYTKEEAIHLAVKMTEEIMSKNIADNKWPSGDGT